MAAHIPAVAKVQVLAGTAEAIPLPAASADLICSATAFHWFDYDKATAEILRIARPGAYLALVWNVRDQGIPWVAEIDRLTDVYRAGDQPRGDHRQILGDGRFELVRETEHRFEHRMPVGSIVDRVLSTSFIAALPESEQEAVREKVLAVIASNPGLAGASEIGFPYICRLYLLRCR
jgi:SAM-dependent methyltransferase